MTVLLGWFLLWLCPNHSDICVGEVLICVLKVMTLLFIKLVSVDWDRLSGEVDVDAAVVMSLVDTIL